LDEKAEKAAEKLSRDIHSSLFVYRVGDEEEIVQIVD
jgi:hypothetical protein